ncbi:cysteine hydrolase family protein [Cellulomonas aerilata]|uniref:Isochorismatase n=1 Tax=Cellulomonas aerilata TaxID=515326 RepID=A0A512DBF1_9CELL|nr:cysteine hydrolase [Cellulomonas aerilata]GEO33811.1 isochorismatase [Cellulomonas aerilata]
MTHDAGTHGAVPGDAGARAAGPPGAGAPGTAGWLVVVDLQHVFGDSASPWAAPRFDEVLPRVRELAAAYGPRVVWTRFVAPRVPVGAWVEYYAQFPFALQPPDAPLYGLVEDPGAHPVVTATTFGKWGPDLAAVVGDGPLTVVGVATDCCVISTVLAAADAGVPVRVVTDACAGSGDEDQERALRVMGLYAPLVELTTSAQVLAGH